MDYYEDYEHYRTLGSGSFGFVSLLKHKKLNKIIACKTIANQNAHSWRNEVSILKILNHANIIKLIGFFRKRDYYIYMEYVDMDLHHYIYNYLASHVYFKENDVAKVAIAIANALEYCHLSSIIHCDVKPSNIVLSKNFDIIKLIDFGISRNIICHSYSSKIGTANYRSPELLFNMNYGTDIDVWGLGCVIAEMFMKKQVFGGRCSCYDNEPRETKSLKIQIYNIIYRLGVPNINDGEIYNHIKYYTYTNKVKLSQIQPLIPDLYNISITNKFMINNIFKWKLSSRLTLKNIISHFHSNSLLVRLDSTNL